MARFQHLGIDTLIRWEQAAKRAVKPEVLEPEWEIANEIFFDRTQQVVHVVTGALKASGRQQVTVENGRLVGTVMYGGGGVDYALIELNRGGDHDYLGRGWEQAQPYFKDLFGRMWIKAFDQSLNKVRGR